LFLKGALHARGRLPARHVGTELLCYGLFTGGLGFHHSAERLGLTVVPVSGGMTERQVKLIGDFKPDIIFVTPSYLLAILDEFRASCGASSGSTPSR